MKQAPVVTQYHSAIQFLQDHYSFRKNQEPTFSYDVWAKEMKLKSRTYLRLVVMGHRPISENLVIAFNAYFASFTHEPLYFTTLVSYSQSKTSQQRELFGKKLMGLSPESKEQSEISQHFDFLSNPLLPKLQTFMSFEDSPQDPAIIASQLNVEVGEVEESLQTLQRMHLLEKNSDGQWKSLKKSWKVPANFKQLGHFEFYRNAFEEAEEAIGLSPEIRRFRSLFVAMDESEFKDFLGDLEVFVNEQLHKRDPAKLEKRRLFHLNFNCFATTKPN